MATAATASEPPIIQRRRVVARLRLAVRLAEERGLELHFENHNLEPEHAEIHYIPHTVAEMRHFFEVVSSPKLRHFSSCAPMLNFSGQPWNA